MFVQHSKCFLVYNHHQYKKKYLHFSFVSFSYSNTSVSHDLSNLKKEFLTVNEQEDFSRFMPQLPEFLKKNPIEAHSSDMMDMETDDFQLCVSPSSSESQMLTTVIETAPIVILTEILDVEVQPSGTNAETTTTTGNEVVNDNEEVSTTTKTTTLVTMISNSLEAAVASAVTLTEESIEVANDDDNILITTSTESTSNAHNFFATTCTLKYKKQKNNNCKCLVKGCDGRPQWYCDNKCKVDKKNGNFFCKIKNKVCFMKFHSELKPDGHYPIPEDKREKCIVCGTRSSVSCSICHERFCLYEKDADNSCFYKVSHDGANVTNLKNEMKKRKISVKKNKENKENKDKNESGKTQEQDKENST